MQDGKVFRDRGRGEAKQFGDLADAQLAPPQRQKNPDASRIGQRLRDGHEFPHDYVISPNNEMTMARRTSGRKNYFEARTIRRRGRGGAAIHPAARECHCS